METVSTVPLELRHHDQPLIDKSDTILAYLQKIDQTNQSLVKRVNELESNRYVSSKPIGPWSQMSANHIHSSHLAQKAHHQSTGPQRPDPTSVSTSNHIPCGSLPGPSNHHAHSNLTVGQTITNQHSQFALDGILPSINTLRQNPSVSQSVAEVMATYENQAKQEATLGKGPQTKKSGHFSTTDTITSVSELRWPNEGYHDVHSLP